MDALKPVVDVMADLSQCMACGLPIGLSRPFRALVDAADGMFHGLERSGGFGRQREQRTQATDERSNHGGMSRMLHKIEEERDFDVQFLHLHTTETTRGQGADMCDQDHFEQD